MKHTLHRWLEHPLTAGLDVDDPATTDRRRAILRRKRFLRRLYAEWYDRLRARIPEGPGRVVELGSGAGFLKETIPEAVTTDLFAVEGVDVVLPADGRLPFADGSLRAIVMTDVLHHIGEPRRFLREAARAVRPGGAIVMVEPWVTAWSRFVYKRFHAEPFRPAAETWEFPVIGPLSGANGALPWILFERDRARFLEEFPEWRIEGIEPLMPFAYLLSGGLSSRLSFPSWMYAPWRRIERTMGRLGRASAMFAVIALARQPDAGGIKEGCG